MVPHPFLGWGRKQVLCTWPAKNRSNRVIVNGVCGTWLSKALLRDIISSAVHPAYPGNSLLPAVRSPSASHAGYDLWLKSTTNDGTFVGHKPCPAAAAAANETAIPARITQSALGTGEPHKTLTILTKYQIVGKLLRP